jgi:DNA-directed RNA polymerase beta subunit
VCTVRQVRKLYALALGSCTEDNPDSLMHHDLMLPGHLMTMAFKERCQDLLAKFKQTVQVTEFSPPACSDLVAKSASRRTVQEAKPRLSDCG